MFLKIYYNLWVMTLASHYKSFRSMSLTPVFLIWCGYFFIVKKNKLFQTKLKLYAKTISLKINFTFLCFIVFCLKLININTFLLFKISKYHISILFLRIEWKLTMLFITYERFFKNFSFFNNCFSNKNNTRKIAYLCVHE